MLSAYSRLAVSHLLIEQLEPRNARVAPLHFFLYLLTNLGLLVGGAHMVVPEVVLWVRVDVPVAGLGDHPIKNRTVLTNPMCEYFPRGGSIVVLEIVKFHLQDVPFMFCMCLHILMNGERLRSALIEKLFAYVVK